MLVPSEAVCKVLIAEALREVAPGMTIEWLPYWYDENALRDEHTYVAVWKSPPLEVRYPRLRRWQIHMPDWLMKVGLRLGILREPDAMFRWEWSTGNLTYAHDMTLFVEE